MMSEFTVEHDEAEQQFFVQLPKQEQAYMKYHFVGQTNKVVDFYTTFVPSSQRGKGLARPLVKAGLDWADSQSYQIKATCSYVNRLLTERE